MFQTSMDSENTGQRKIPVTFKLIEDQQFGSPWGDWHMWYTREQFMS